MTTIRVLHETPNERGDLLTQLTEAYFIALGYQSFAFNVAKSGREIDLQGRHITEDRLVRAECKAQTNPVGGAAVNKFAGALQVERASRAPVAVSGYFLSISGFTSTAVEQEAEAARNLILVGPDAIVTQLITGKVLVSARTAVDAARQLVPDSGKRLTGKPEVLATLEGWIWSVIYGDGHDATHAVLVHADGQPLSDKTVKRLLPHLQTYFADIAIITPEPSAQHDVTAVAELYKRYIERECGCVSFEGLPTDEGLTGKRLRLDDIYVPMLFERVDETLALTPARQSVPAERHRAVHATPTDGFGGVTLPQLLERSKRVAMLGPPGAGKSTVLKRLATAQLFEGLRNIRGEDIPASESLPLFLRCRQLDGAAKLPILDVLKSIAAQAELQEYQEAFCALLMQSLHDGTAVLLIDGLDEIADERSRLIFVQQLTRFLSVYPATRIAITSREAGFRAVAGAMSTLCDLWRIAPLSYESVVALTEAWYAQALGRTERFAGEASRVATEVWANERVRMLATNPLLLTTLLLVRRWTGELPRKRTILYDRAIDVLLITWNVEGHSPLRSDEAIPQLAFVAYRMMQMGVQTVSQTVLEQLLIEARTEMPELLGFVDMSPAAFIARVEERSSLLSYSGHTVERGRLEALYEFRHLTFQEYLSALALCNRYLPKHEAGVGLATKVRSLTSNATWTEALSLAAVLAGSRANDVLLPVVERLRTSSRQAAGRLTNERARSKAARNKAFQCFDIVLASLADDVTISPDFAREVCSAVVDTYTREMVLFDHEVIRGVAGSKFAPLLDDMITARWTSARGSAALSTASVLASVWADAKMQRLRSLQGDADAFACLVRDLHSSSELSRSFAAFCVMFSAYRAPTEPSLVGAESPIVAEALAEMIRSGKQRLAYPACWALSWLISDCWTPDERTTVELLRELEHAWVKTLKGPLRRFAAWALSALPMVDPASRPLGDLDDEMEAFLLKQERALRDPRTPGARHVPAACIVVGCYYGGPWPKEFLADRLVEHSDSFNEEQLRVLGEALGVQAEAMVERDRRVFLRR